MDLISELQEALRTDEQAVRVLVIEDSDVHARLIKSTVDKSKGGRFEIDREPSLGGAIDRVKGDTFDLILLDLGLPDSKGGMATFEAVKEVAGEIPIVILTQLDDEETGREAVRRGAQDYLVKGRQVVSGLGRSLEYALERGRIHRQQKELLSARERLNQQLKAANQLLRDIVTVATTEFKNPLQALAGYMPSLRPGDESGRGPEAYEKVQGCISRLKQLVDNIAMMSMLDSGITKMQHAPFPLAAVLEETVAETASGRRITVKCPEGLKVHADKEHFKWAVGSLLANALAYGDEPIAVSVSDARGGDQVEVWISDEGEGVPDLFAPLLFERFSRLPRGGSQPGSGLGLFLVGRIAASWGGEARYEPNSPRGSRFALSLPKA